MSAPLFTRLYPYLLVFIIGAVWGGTFSLVKIATSQGAHPIGLSFWQAFGGGVFLWLFCAVRGKLPPLNKTALQRYIIIGILGSIVPGTLYFYSASHVPAGILAVTTTVVPLLTYGFSLLLRIDTCQPKRALGIVIGFVAILLLLAPGATLPSQGNTVWLLLALLAGVFYTFENLYIDQFIPQDTDMVALLTGSLLVASLGLLPLSLAQGAWVSLQLPFGHVEWAMLGMALASCIAYTLFLMLIKLAGAVFASLSTYVITVAGIFWGMVIFDETHSLWAWAAFVLLLIGMALVTPREKPTEEQASP